MNQENIAKNQNDLPKKLTAVILSATVIICLIGGVLTFLTNPSGAVLKSLVSFSLFLFVSHSLASFFTFRLLLPSSEIDEHFIDLKEAFHNAPNAVILVNKNGELYKANAVAEEALDIEALLKAKKDLFDMPARAVHNEFIEDAGENYDLAIKTLFDEQDEHLGFLLVCSKVTDLLNFEKEANSYKEIIDSLSPELIIKDDEGHILGIDLSSMNVSDDEVVIEANSSNVDEMLAKNIAELARFSDNLEANSKELTVSMNKINDDSGEVQNYINSVGVATEEMIASISEISKNTDRAANMTQDAVREIESTEGIIKDLQERSNEISSILKVVTEIANQTNLLALNATIEAARAGDAGKGFAVVANEVKELANRTAEATEDINNKIIAIQSESANAIHAIETATGSVKSINEVAVTIASSVEEQNAVTTEIGRSMQNSTDKVNDMITSIGSVSGLVLDASENAGEINNITDVLEQKLV